MRGRRISYELLPFQLIYRLLYYTILWFTYKVSGELLTVEYSSAPLQWLHPIWHPWNWPVSICWNHFEFALRCTNQFQVKLSLFRKFYSSSSQMIIRMLILVILHVFKCWIHDEWKSTRRLYEASKTWSIPCVHHCCSTWCYYQH